MKITDDDIKKLFEEPIVEQKPFQWKEPKEEKVKIKKHFPKGHNEIKKIRHKIRKFKITDQQNLKTDLIEPVLRFLAVSGFSGFLIFLIMGYSGISEQLKWMYFTDYLGEEMPEAPARSPAPSPRPVKTPDVIGLPGFVPSLSTAEEGNYIKIDKISLNAPVIWEVPEEDIIENLKNGVTHYKGTSLPGEGGNIFIVGHSSNYFWVKSDYNNVFALIDKLESGDRIEVRKGQKSYFYDFLDKKVIAPGEVEILQNTPKETLTLMTCWPIGTSLKRMIVQAEFVYSSN